MDFLELARLAASFLGEGGFLRFGVGAEKALKRSVDAIDICDPQKSCPGVSGTAGPTPINHQYDGEGWVVRKKYKIILGARFWEISGIDFAPFRGWWGCACEPGTEVPGYDTAPLPGRRRRLKPPLRAAGAKKTSAEADPTAGYDTPPRWGEDGG